MMLIAALEYAAAWIQLPLPFGFNLKALKLARPTTRLARAARAARAAVRRAAIAVRRIKQNPKPKARPKTKGTMANTLQRPLTLAMEQLQEGCKPEAN